MKSGVWFRCLIAFGIGLLACVPAVADTRRAGESWSFVVAGDHFEDPPEGMVDAIIEQRPRFVASTGDLLYQSRPRDYRRLDRVMLQPLRKIGAEFYPCMGNHDFPVVPNWKQLWGDLKGRNYYSVDVGNTHLVFLDSNRAAVGDREYEEGSEPYHMQRQGEPLHPGSRQFEWLKEDLAHTEKPFVFVFFHHPLLSFGGHRGLPQLQRDLAPLFEQHRVTAVFTGHSHGYERFVPARAIIEDKRVRMVADNTRGIPYVVTASGSSRRNLYDIKQHALHAAFKKAPNFVVVEIRGGVAHCRAIEPPHGKVIDEFVLKARAKQPVRE